MKFIDQLTQEKKQKLLVGVFVVVVIATVAFLYFGLWRSPSSEEYEMPETGELPGAAVELDEFGEEIVVVDRNVYLGAGDLINKINFDIEFLKTSRFQDLDFYGDWPLEIGEKGRQNPFLPY